MAAGRKQSRERVRLTAYGTLAALAALATGGVVGGCSSSKSAGASAAGGSTGASPAHQETPGFVRLSRNIHPLARPEYDVGPLDPSKRIEGLSIVFKPTPQQVADRDALLAAQVDPHSSSYRQWLTRDEYAARFGATAEAIEKTRTWLASQGLEVKRTSPLGFRVVFSGDVGHLQSAFQTEMHRFQIGGETHYAMVGAPAIPAELSDLVLAVRRTHDFYPHPMTRGAKATPMAKCPDAYCNGFGIAPPDWDVLYNVPSTATGQGIDIGIVGISQIAQGDINAFRTRYGLPASTVTMTLVPDTGPAAPPGSGAGLEAILDTEWSGAIAPLANIHYYYVGDFAPGGNPANTGDVDEAVSYAIEDDTVSVLSESFGGGECGWAPGDGDVAEVLGSAANLLGITYLASSGDSGAEGCQGYAPGLYVDLPAAYPGVTAVGGSEFPQGTINYDPNTGYATAYSTSEEVWSETASGRTVAGGGGISMLYPRPAYQSSLLGITTCSPVGQLPPGVSASTMRQVPDVSFAAAGYASGGANNGILIECSLASNGGDCLASSTNPVVLAISGTSASSPAFAGAVALLDQSVGGVRLGNINPMLYAIHASSGGAAAFHDITLGNNEEPCTAQDQGCTGTEYGFAAAQGYDCASGLGSINFGNLITAWSALSPTTTSVTAAPATTTIGSKVTLTANVTKSDGTALTGSVNFSFQSYLSNGTIDDSWTLGSGTVDSTGAATISVPVPSGLVTPGAQLGVDVFAQYGGDATHLSSSSTAPFHVSFSAPSGFCIQPATASIVDGQSIQYSSEGAIGAVRWYLDYDSTCKQTGASNVIGTLGATMTENTGLLTAGTGSNGYILVEAVDSVGQETFGYVTVGSAPYAGQLPWGDDAGIVAMSCPNAVDGGGIIPIDAGEDAGGGGGGEDSGPPMTGGNDSGPAMSNDSGPTMPPPASDDAGPVATDAGGESSSPGSKGCGCTTAGSEGNGSMAGMFGGLGLGLAMMARRRRGRK